MVAYSSMAVEVPMSSFSPHPVFSPLHGSIHGIFYPRGLFDGCRISSPPHGGIQLDGCGGPDVGPAVHGGPVAGGEVLVEVLGQRGRRLQG